MILNISGPEFVSDEGNIMLIVRDLYGPSRNVASLRSMLADTWGKDGLWHTSSETNKGIWIKKEVFTNGKTYYLIILVYVDDILVVLKETSNAID